MITIDLERGFVSEQSDDSHTQYSIGSPEAFALISKAWLRSGWDGKYVYSFSWFGRPIIQLPEDLMRAQEVLYRLKPDLIIETGVAHGGSLVFYASLCKAMGKGRVIGVDIEIRPQNRRAIEDHELASYITLFEGSSVDPLVLRKIAERIAPSDTVFVMLDSNHSREHVLAELEAYSAFVSPGSFIVAADGIMADLEGAPRSNPDWRWNNPQAAALDFVHNNPGFSISPPTFEFNEGSIEERVTYWPNAWIRKNG